MPGGVRCPRCQAATAPTAMALKGDVITEFIGDSYRWVPGIYNLETKGDPQIKIVTCQSCGGIVVVVIDETRGTATAVWPLGVPKVPEGVPPKIGEAYADARLALAAGSKIGALMAGRTTLTRLLRDKGAKNYKELEERKILTPGLYGGADQLRLWAGIIGHDDIDLGALDGQEVLDVLDYLGTILQAVYTHQAIVDRLAARTKQLQAKPPPPPMK